MTPSISLIVTTYNWPVALNAVLRSISHQQQLPFEVLIADDGSKQDTQLVIEEWQQKALFKIKHIWQEDDGFQAARIRNKAAVQAEGNYLIFLDGDCLLRPDFIKRHSQLATPGYFVAGNRALLSESFTSELLENDVTVETWPSSQFTKTQINRTWPLRYLPLGWLRKLKSDQWEGVKTCNLAIWKDDLKTVNGLDEAFVGWGYEDSDLVIRLLRSGLKRLNGRFATTVLHLWHQEHDRSMEQENWQRLLEVINSDKQKAVLGIKQYLPSD